MTDFFEQFTGMIEEEPDPQLEQKPEGYSYEDIEDLHEVSENEVIDKEK